MNQADEADSTVTYCANNRAAKVFFYIPYFLEKVPGAYLKLPLKGGALIG